MLSTNFQSLMKMVPYEYIIDELEVEGFETTVEGFDLINTRAGYVRISGEKHGMIFLKDRVEVPEDFILDETPKMAVLDTDGEVIELTFVNEPEINELPDTGGEEEPEEEPEEEDIKDKTEDEKPELPKTGSIHYSFWSLQGMLLIMGGLLLLKRRKTA